MATSLAYMSGVQMFNQIRCKFEKYVDKIFVLAEHLYVYLFLKFLLW